MNNNYTKYSERIRDDRKHFERVRDDGKALMRYAKLMKYEREEIEAKDPIRLPSKSLKNQVWNEATMNKNFDEKVFRQDILGNIVCRVVKGF